MQIIGTVGSVLGHKNRPEDIWHIGPEATVFEAIQMMSERNVGALLVMSGEKLLGIVSERDYTRKVALKGRASKETQVKEIISGPVIEITPELGIEECMRLMTTHRVRHLPVVENGKVVGMLSIGDFVNWIISTQSHVINQLQSYIQGSY